MYLGGDVLKKEEVIRAIEGLNEIDLNDVILAVCKVYDHINKDKELAVVSLPKNNEKKREQVVRQFCEMARKDDCDWLL